jgi:hypothetical protein
LKALAEHTKSVVDRSLAHTDKSKKLMDLEK